MLEQLTQIEHEALAALSAVNDKDALENWRVTQLGKKSPLLTVLGELGKLSKEERPAIGKRGNEVKQAMEAAYANRVEALRKAELEHSLTAGALDVTLPGRPIVRGRLHPATQTLREMYAIWAAMGFQVYQARDVETDEYNFELLNIPKHHPARDMWDTFYTTTPNVILRTHTSPGQIHAMHEYCPQPIRVILPGMVYRYEQMSAAKEIQFHQVEGLAVGKNVRLTDLLGTLTEFNRRMFGPDRATRFRSSYFPFTEPSIEVDVSCANCGGKGCGVCKHTGWLEIAGAGMVHPTVLRNGGYDPAVYSGFAFGMGPQRITMLKYGISDIRYFWGNDLRFLEQF
ncbi:MAG: phenylalanine--tRNA ligase subunit alpha [Thermoflexales bacterium]|nr:phenylalanine--tRNA ligase subunit alpha [Thermoflexales bacterium]